MSIKAVEKQQIMQIKLAFHHENVKNAPIEEQGYRNVRSLVCDSAKRAALLRKSGAVILPKTCLRGESVALRTQKRWILVDEVGDNAAKLQTDQIRYVRLNDEYVRFSKAAGLRTQVERAEVSGFGPKQGKAATNTVANVHESDIIKTIRDKGSASQRYPASQDRIDTLIKDDMPNIRFSMHPTYNPRLRCNGKTTYLTYSWGEFKELKSVEIGKQDRSSAEFLEDTILHEELEARIAMAKTAKHSELSAATDDVRHAYINAVIKRYFKLRGWHYDLG